MLTEGLFYSPRQEIDMAEIHFECPECKQSLAIDAGNAGADIQCPTCSKSITVPKTADPATTHPKYTQLKRNTTVVIVGIMAVVVASILTVQGLNWFNRAQSQNRLSRGNEELEKGNYDGAIADFDSVIKYAPELTEAYLRRGEARYKSSDYNGALADFNYVMQVKPNCPGILVDRGTANYSLSNFDGAWSDYSEEIRLNPQDANAYCYRGLVEENRGDYDGALGDYNKAIEINPDFTDAIQLRDKLKASHQDATPEPSLVSVINLFQEHLNGNIGIKDEQGFTTSKPAAQAFFDLIHPIGTGKKITVLDAVLNKGDDGNVQTVGLKLKLDWQGPVQSGSTTFEILYDISHDMYLPPPNVIQTDGITRDNLNDFANGFVIGAQIGGDIHDAFSGN
jgi:tetratricopeptide (TPR) repeat protein